MTDEIEKKLNAFERFFEGERFSEHITNRTSSLIAAVRELRRVNQLYAEGVMIAKEAGAEFESKLKEILLGER
jgi:hypothetical protein